MPDVSGWVDWAIHDPVNDPSHRVNDPYRYNVHIAVTEADDIYGPGKGHDGTYAHYYHPKWEQVRQHQDVDCWSYADLYGNGNTISGESEGEPGDHLTDNQLDSHARAFADAVVNRGVPNRIATWDNTHGLAWHRLGCQGNFGRFDPDDMTTWCTEQTGVVFSGVFGKTCPTDNFIHQIPEIYRRAQRYISGGAAGGYVPPEVEVIDNDDLQRLAEAVWHYTNADVASGEWNTHYLLRHLYRSQGDIPEAVWKYTDPSVALGEWNTHYLLRDIKRNQNQQAGERAGLLEAIRQISGGQDIDLDAISQAAEAGAHKAVEDALGSLEADVNLTINDTTTEA